MKKDEINSKLAEHARRLSPRDHERNLVSTIYQSFNDLFGINNCIQIGSYPRFTAITPIHDLDILYIIGDWDKNSHNPSIVLNNLLSLLRTEYKNPTKYQLDISLQSHSVTILFKDGSTEIFSIDIVPAYKYSKNEFQEDTYKVPEVLRKKHGSKRVYFYDTLRAENKDMEWITTDPRGYIKMATDIDTATNGKFRKSVKIIKYWKNNLTNHDEKLKFKSFHLEQVILKYFQDDPDLTIFDAVFKFFIELPILIEKPNQITDRANADKYIDDYLSDLTRLNKEQINEIKDGFLVELENITEAFSFLNLFNIKPYTRNSASEQFLFDFGIPVLLDKKYKISVEGEVLERKGGFRSVILDALGLISVDRKINFSVKLKTLENLDYFKWKVKNDNNSGEPRGEITDHQTRNVPEHTKYRGNHFVECYAIKNNVCVARAKQNVKLN